MKETSFLLILSVFLEIGLKVWYRDRQTDRQTDGRKAMRNASRSNVKKFFDKFKHPDSLHVHSSLFKVVFVFFSELPFTFGE